MEENNAMSPELRFPEFSGEWKEHRLDTPLAHYSKGKGVAKADITEDGAFECIRYGELYTDYKEVIDEVLSRTNLPESDLVLSEANDVIIPASGETRIDIATASCVIRSGVALGGDLNIIKTSLNGVFLAYYLNNTRKYAIARLAQGISVVHLYSSQLKSLKINVPEPAEQKKIAAFLTAIDTHIKLLTEKKQRLERYKKGLMQKLFPKAGETLPELRFKDENGKEFPDWEEKRLGALGVFAGGGTPATEVSNYWEGNIGWLSSSDIIEDDIRVGKITRYITEKAITESAAKLIPAGSLLFVARVGVGKVAVSVEPICTSQDFVNFTPFEINSAWLAYFFLANKNLLKRYAQGTSIKGFTIDVLKTMVVRCPKVDEQNKIVSAISNIVQLEDVVKGQLLQIENMKKHLLQNMFV